MAVPGMPRATIAALRKLGADIAAARKRRRFSTSSMAERAFVSRPTLRRIEAGDPGVSIGMYLAVLSILGLARGIGDLASIENDPLGLTLEEERLPKRIRRRKSEYYPPR
jgi:transcriptional regulator with XRE-family HTH domain